MWSNLFRTKGDLNSEVPLYICTYNVLLVVHLMQYSVWYIRCFKLIRAGSWWNLWLLINLPSASCYWKICMNILEQRTQFAEFEGLYIDLYYKTVGVYNIGSENWLCIRLVSCLQTGCRITPQKQGTQHQLVVTRYLSHQILPFNTPHQSLSQSGSEVAYPTEKHGYSYPCLLVSAITITKPAHCSKDLAKTFDQF